MSKLSEAAKEISDLKDECAKLEAEVVQLQEDHKQLLDGFISNLQSKQVPRKNIAFLLSWTEENLDLYLETAAQEAHKGT